MNNPIQGTFGKIISIAKMFASVLLAFMEISIDKSYVNKMLSLLLFSRHAIELIYEVSHDISEDIVLRLCPPRVQPNI